MMRQSVTTAAVAMFGTSHAIVDGPPPEERAASLVATMNLTEKITLLGGVWGLGYGPPDHPYVGNVREIERVGIPWLSLQDGPQGYRDGKYGPADGHPGTATQWPSGLTIAAMWDPKLATEWGAAMGREFRGKGANCHLGPGLNVARIPQGGRNFEYMSGEDPFLGAALAGPTVMGIQSSGVIATAKHYMLNNQEDHRGNMSSNIDERALMEIYSPPFQSAVRAGVGSIMCGYNRINNDWACENNQTLMTILKERDSFKGFVMSDWGGTHSTVKAALAGLDQEMPGGGFFTEELLGGAISNGSLAESVVDGMATRVLTPMFAMGIMDSKQPTGLPGANVTSAAHAELARRLAEQAAVLLQNAGILPLSGTESLAVIGAAANCEAPVPSFGFGWPSTIGCMNAGGGSGGVDTPSVEGVLAGLRRRSSGAVSYDSGADPLAAARVAAAADVAVVMVAVTSSEGDDRDGTSLPAGQLAYLRAVAAAQPRTVVVVMTPGAMTMDWAADVAAVACFFLPGQAQGAVVASVLFGDVNPVGRLPVTMPLKDNELEFTEDQYPGIAFSDGLQTNYSEGLEVGYRWYLVHNVTPAFAFGTGLSYTSFEYSEPTVSSTDAGHEIAFSITNVGDVAGAEIAQLYVEFPAAAGEAPLQLKGFEKIGPLAPGASSQVKLVLSSQALSIWDVSARDWVAQSGEFVAAVGGGLSDIRHRVSFLNMEVEALFA